MKHQEGLSKVPFDGYTAQLHEGEAFINIDGSILLVVHVEDEFFICKRDDDCFNSFKRKDNDTLKRMAGYPKTMTLDAVIEDARKFLKYYWMALFACRLCCCVEHTKYGYYHATIVLSWPEVQ